MPKNISGVILAGGRAQRMGGQDKGLVEFKGKPLVAYAIAAMQPIVGELLISANRNLERYRQWGLPVITDQDSVSAGPLAGILAALAKINAEVLVVMPCDTPLVTTAYLQKLVAQLNVQQADIAVAFDGERLHPVLMAIKTELRPSLQAYLQAEQRKVEGWLNQHRAVRVDFQDQRSALANINTLAELSALEQQTSPVFKR